MHAESPSSQQAARETVFLRPSPVPPPPPHIPPLYIYDFPRLLAATAEGEKFLPYFPFFYFSSRYGKEVLRDREGDAITFPPLFSAYPPHPFPRAGHRHICVVYVQTSLCVIATIFARPRLRRPPAQIRIRKKEQEGKMSRIYFPLSSFDSGFFDSREKTS